jgi:HKD family nuclease
VKTINYIAQPTFRSTNEAIHSVLQNDAIQRIDVAAAYISSSGIDVLLRTMSDASCAQSSKVVKRWITSFDYCRTDPVALETLLALPSSSVRIHDGSRCLHNRGAPTVPFHPKAFLVRGRQYDCVLAGSGNISRSGLLRGFEVGLVIGINRSLRSIPRSTSQAVRAIQRYFAAIWKGAAPLNAGLLAGYTALYDSVEHLKNPIPTEDDVVTSDISRGSLSTEDLKKLRVCRHFWIYGGNITKNRGPHLPGNQLMMKRLSRVFFGFEPTALAKDSPIGHVTIAFDKSSGAEYSLTFSNNGMDKLVLPIPGSGNGTPESYDNKYLLFERIRPRQFELTLAQTAVAWRTRSDRIGGSFTMSQGREWGVF